MRNPSYCVSHFQHPPISPVHDGRQGGQIWKYNGGRGGGPDMRQNKNFYLLFQHLCLHVRTYPNRLFRRFAALPLCLRYTTENLLRKKQFCDARQDSNRSRKGFTKLFVACGGIGIATVEDDNPGPVIL